MRCGQTAVISTLETIDFPDNIAGIGFPPSHLSIRGLLITNPGHVDPGYKGKMTFTVINMAKDPIALIPEKMEIVTLLLFELDSNVKSGFTARREPSLT